jgi:hypothetical protein
LRAEGDSPKAIYEAESKLCHLQSSIRLESDVLMYPNLRHFGMRSSPMPEQTNLSICLAVKTGQSFATFRESQFSIKQCKECKKLLGLLYNVRILNIPDDLQYRCGNPKPRVVLHLRNHALILLPQKA